MLLSCIPYALYTQFVCNPGYSLKTIIAIHLLLLSAYFVEFCTAITSHSDGREVEITFELKLTICLHLVLRLRMRGAIPSLLQYVFMGWCSVKKHRDNFTFMMKCSRAMSRVKWLSGEKKTFRRPSLSSSSGYPETFFFTARPFDPADSPRKLHHTQSPGKQQI
jgi:hypothetical protein